MAVRQKKILQLFSGGYDSTYLLIKNLEKGYIVQPLYIDFNNLGPDKIAAEHEAVLRIYEQLVVSYPDTLMHPEFMFHSGLARESNRKYKEWCSAIKTKSKLKKKADNKKSDTTEVVKERISNIKLNKRIHNLKPKKMTYEEWTSEFSGIIGFTYNTGNVNSIQPIAWILGIFAYLNNHIYIESARSPENLVVNYDEVQIAYVMNDDSVSYLSEITALYNLLFKFNIIKINIPKLTFPEIKQNEYFTHKFLHNKYTKIYMDCHSCESPVYNKDNEEWEYCGHCGQCIKLKSRYLNEGYLKSKFYVRKEIPGDPVDVMCDSIAHDGSESEGEESI